MIYPTRYPKCPVKNDSAQPDHTADISKKVDLIDRQAAIDAISCNIIMTGRQNAELVAATIGTFADRIKALPSAQPEQQWIPCSERLPEKEGKYLVTVRWSPNGKFRVDVLDYGHKVDDAWLEKEWLLSDGSAFGERWGDTIDNIEETLAWMPLPEPWKEYETEGEGG